MLPPTLVKVTIVYGCTERAHPLAARADDLADATVRSDVTGEADLGDLPKHVALRNVLRGFFLGHLRLVAVRVRYPIITGLVLHAH